MSNELHNVLAEETETKTAGTTESKIWNFDNVEEAEEINGEDNQEKHKEKTTTTKETEKPAGKITEKAKRSSARVAVGMLDMLQKSVFTPIISHKYKKKFTEDEINALDQKNIIDKDPAQLAGEDLLLRNKWDRLMSKCQKKIEAIPMDETEKTDCEEAFYTYFDFKEKTLPPEWFVGFAILNSIGKRVVDVVTE